MHVVWQGLLCCLLGYAFGNFSPAFLLGRARGYDVREEGSGNVGATNAFILLGKNAFFLTAALDILKAFFAWKLCAYLFPTLQAAGPLGGASCILGHIYPVLLRFRGGKGLATIGGVVLAWNWEWFFILLALAAAIAFGTRYVSLVAPAISVIFPACYYWMTGLLLCALILLLPALPIFARHWENFARIRAGTEMRTSFIWNKEGELKRIGKWNQKTQSQLKRRGKP
ncbi:MAG: glycerol-3-phosphate acyltransferase [Oscillospiraceae bacterium]|nr:glycerol-3-phosphate acyltransferase [Oscillospiraceae bacterium]